MKKIILALASLFISEQSIAATKAVDNHQPLPKTKKVTQKAQAKVGSQRNSAPTTHPTPATTNHAITAKKTNTPHTAEKCPKNCHEAGVMLQHIHDLRVQIEDKQANLNPQYKKKKINPVNMAQFKGTCEKSCPQLTGIQRQVDKYEKDLAALNAKVGTAVPAGKATKGQAKAAQSAEKCPKNCHEAGVMLQHIHDLRVQIEDKQASLNPHYKKKKINAVNIAQFKGTCEKSCPQLTGIQRQVDKYEQDLAALNAKVGTAVPAGKATKGQAKAAQTAEKCPKNCHEAGIMLQHIHDLRVQIEDKQASLNPAYQKKKINPVNVAQFKGTCENSCPQITGIQRQVDKYEQDLADLNAKAGTAVPAGKATKGQAKAAQTAEKCPKNCHEAGVMLQHIHDLRVQIEDKQASLNPAYQKKKINPVNVAQFKGTCETSCPQLTGIQRQVDKYEQDLAALNTKTGTTAPVGKGQAKTDQPAEKCPKNCFDLGEKLEAAYKLQLEIENEHKRQDPSYQKKSIKPVDIRRFQGTCDASCPAITQAEKQIQRFKKELADLKAKNPNPATKTSATVNEESNPDPTAGSSQPQRLKGQCTPNCDNEVDLRISIRQKNIELDQLKLAQDPTFKVRTYEKEINPNIKIGKQCPIGCKNITQLESREAQLVAELDKVKANSKTIAPKSASVKGQCTPNCDNEVDLRTDIRQLNSQVEELKHQQNPSYRMKIFKDIDQSIKIGKQCPVACNNIKRLEKRKAELETMVATHEKTAPLSPVEEETDLSEPTATASSEEVNEPEAAASEFTDENSMMEAPTEEASEEPAEEPQTAAAPQKKRGIFNRLTSTVTKHAVRAASTVRDAFLARPRKTNDIAATNETYGVDTEEPTSDTPDASNPSINTTIDEESMGNQEAPSDAAIPSESASEDSAIEETIQAETAEQDMDTPIPPNSAPHPFIKKKAGNDQNTIVQRGVPTKSADEETSDSVSQTSTSASETDVLDSNTLPSTDEVAEQDNEQKPTSKAVLPPNSSVEGPDNEEPTSDNAVIAADTPPNTQGYESSDADNNQYEDNGESSISTDETTEYSNTPYGNDGNLGNTDGGEIFHSDSDDNDKSNALNTKAMGAIENIFNGLLTQQQPQAQQPSMQQSPDKTASVPQQPAAMSQDEDNSVDNYDPTTPDNNSSVDQSYGQDGVDNSYGANDAYGDFSDTTATNDNTAGENDAYGSNADAAY
ncbi:MAG: hypothetical protein K0M45_09760 [Candidatus Paracaedibacteraceae bacterium]|nr:hypothetical protein [Candidatus Paracaedibacteraceae bacterium]